MVWSTMGWAAAETRTAFRFFSRHMATASAAADAPSYTEALDTSMPVSSQIMVWYSKMDWSTPWEISA